jgi:hypothetical protein
MLVLRRAPFLLSAGFVFAICALLLRSQAFARNPDVAAWGITFDLTITIPLLYWLFVVRAGKAPAITLAPLFVLCTFAASALVPNPFVRDLARFAVPLAELAVIAAIVHRIRRGRGTNPLENRVFDIIESEVMMVVYAFAGWRMKPAEVEGRAITFHERSDWSTILAAIFVLIAAEGIGMHLLLAMWSPYAAWAWTALDLWAVMWLLGDYHALRLRRSSLTADALHIHLGMRWSVSIPLTSIESVHEIRDESEWRRRDVLKVAILDEPRWLITLCEPVTAKGLAGFRKEIRALALRPDEDDVITAMQRAAAS